MSKVLLDFTKGDPLRPMMAVTHLTSADRRRMTELLRKTQGIYGIVVTTTPGFSI